MIRNPIDASVQVSPELSVLIEHRVNDSDLETPVTLGEMRDFVEGIMPSALLESESLHHFGPDESHLNELNALIEAYGEDALAIEFIRTAASEAMTRVIESAINDDNHESPTLADIRDALHAGLSNRLVGEGVLDDDEDDPLLAELDFLIERHGLDMLAEHLIRYE
ncbi:MAG TPA: hypothetical protein VK959_08900 [Methylophilaceae bacterium]|jgi:hypothetical protein|nr:hypothetical protein [Methylophilaceae bacterium]